MTEIVFKEERLEYLLNLLGKDVDDEGFIVDPETRERVVSSSGNELKLNNLGVVVKDKKTGENIWVEDNFVAMVEAAENQKTR